MNRPLPGGQTISTRGSPGRSSSGSGVAVAAGLCAVAVGTETSGLILSPSDQISGVKMVRVATVIDNAELRLKTGMTGYAKIDCGTRPLIEVLAHGAVGALRVEVWSWW